MHMQSNNRTILSLTALIAALSMAGCQTCRTCHLSSWKSDAAPLPTVATRPAIHPLESAIGANKVTVMRAQSPDSGPFWYGNQNAANSSTSTGTTQATAQTPQSATQSAWPVQQASNNPAAASNGAANANANTNGQVQNSAFLATQIGNQNNGGTVQQTAYQYPELSTRGNVSPGNGLASPNIGDPNQLNPIVQPYERGGNASIPFGAQPDVYYPAADYADLDVTIAQTNTGRINIGGAYNSDNGIVGQFIIDEKDFDITRFPRNFRDILDGNAFRGGGQAFRLEIVPGQDLKRYLVSFSEPFFLGTDFSFSASGYLFDRRYFDWDENRLGGRLSFGRRLTPDLSISSGVRMERVNIDNPRVNTSNELNNSLGKSNLFLGNVGLIRDTRDHPFLPTEGSFLSATFSQAFGDFDYSRADVEYRRYRLLYERPDRSGRHTLSFGTKLGFSGDDTPIYENYFAGGFSTLRGFDFRGAAPIDGGARVGGEFQWLNTVEYMFPLTADDMVKGVVFCDYGTVESSIDLNKENFRVAPGFGFRVHMPAAGIGAPLAFDFAFPVATAEGDDEKIFSFYLGVLR